MDGSDRTLDWSIREVTARRAALARDLRATSNVVERPALKARLVAASAELARLLTEQDVLEEDEFVGQLAERMLRIIDEVGPQGPSALSKRCDVDPSQISRAARVLIERGVLAAERHEADGRRRVYRRTTAAVPKPIHTDAFAEAVDRFTATDGVSDMVPLLLGDGLEPAAQQHVLAALTVDIDSGVSEPTLAYSLPVPKDRGGLRPAAVLRFSDRVVYSGLVESCRAAIESELAPEVLWPRGQRSAERWDDLEQLVRGSNDEYVVVADVQSFYDSIRHEVLADALQRTGVEQSVLDALIAWLGTIMGRPFGLPQGLPPSDPLASIVLAPLDSCLREAGIEFARHGDDIRCMATSLADGRRIEVLIQHALRDLGLHVNSGKTGPMRRTTYCTRRAAVAGAVEAFLQHSDIDGGYRSTMQLLRALGADGGMQWDGYHRSLTLDDLLQNAGRSVTPGDEHALLVLLTQVARSQSPADNAPSVPSDDRGAHGFIVRASLGLLGRSESFEQADLPAWLVGRPEYTSTLASYIERIAPRRPVEVARLLEQIEQSGAYDSQWLRFYAAISAVDDGNDFRSLAVTHATSSGRDPMLRLRAASFAAAHGEVSLHTAAQVMAVPRSLGEEALRFARIVGAPDLGERLRLESSTTRALIEAA